ncbi:DUF6538 domain-containing protein [Pseudoroseomonas wenyumeiae]
MRGHLVRRGAVYWFRRRVPDALAERLGRRELHRSLGTSHPGEAAIRAKKAWLATEAIFVTVKRNPTLAERQAQLLVDQLLSEPLFTSSTADDLVDSCCAATGR